MKEIDDIEGIDGVWSSMKIDNRELGTLTPSGGSNFLLEKDINRLKTEIKKGVKEEVKKEIDEDVQELINVESRKVKDNLKDLKDSQKSANTFMMSIAIGIIIVFFLASVAIFLDYFKYNEEGYEKFLDKMKESESNFYTKEYLRETVEENKKNTKTLECLKNKGYFTVKCYE